MNNPVNMVDENGHVGITTVLATIVTILIGAFTIAATPPETIEAATQGIASIVTTVTDAVSNITKKTTSVTKTAVATGATTITKTLTKIKKAPIVFPVDPYEFNPKGLTRVELAGTSNGRIIQWRGINNKVRFEWDEDLKQGSHYHITPNGNHTGIGSIHYKPLMIIPEPYRSIYFD